MNRNWNELAKDVLPFAALGLALAGSVLLGWNDIAKHLGDFRQQRNQMVATAKAKERYKSGCLLVYSYATKQPTSLVAGQPIYNKAIAGPFPEGTTVCSQYGGTAIIEEKPLTFRWQSPAGFTVQKSEEYPVVSDIAVTGEIPENAKIVDKKPRAYLGRIAETKN
jgi:hypothetical protein